jgi:Thioredoxin like C-terminal domain
MKTNRLLVAGVLATAIGAPMAGFVAEMKGQPMTSAELQLPFLHGVAGGQPSSSSELTSLARATEWLNSAPLTASALQGKVVVIDFWTYTCITGDVGREPTRVDARGIEVAADWRNLSSPENYVGYERTENFASPGGVSRNQRHVYALPSRLGLNNWALSGDWTMKSEAVVLNKPNGRIAYRFHARDLHLVMGPPAPGTSVRFRVLIDGQPPGAAHGADVDEQGNGTLIEQRLHQLIRESEPITDRQFEIEFLDPGAEAFAFTFG